MIYSSRLKAQHLFGQLLVPCVEFRVLESQYVSYFWSINQLCIYFLNYRERQRQKEM